METQHFAGQPPMCPCGAQLGAGHRTLCRKCTARNRWIRRHRPRGSHGGADRGLRTRRNRKDGEA
jgi:hypothetical protein